MHCGMKPDTRKNREFFTTLCYYCCNSISYFTRGVTDTAENSLKYLNFPIFSYVFNQSTLQTYATILHATYNTKRAHLICFPWGMNDISLKWSFSLLPSRLLFLLLTCINDYDPTHSSSSWCSFTTTRVSCSTTHLFISLTSLVLPSYHFFVLVTIHGLA